MQDFMAVNLAHGQLRRRLVTPDKMILVEGTIGKQGADRFLDSGITGVTPGKVGAFVYLGAVRCIQAVSSSYLPDVVWHRPLLAGFQATANLRNACAVHEGGEEASFDDVAALHL